MQRRRARALPVVLAACAALVACKPKPTEPASSTPTSSAQQQEAWADAYNDTDTRAIAPREVCDHLAALVTAEAGLEATPFDAAMMQECEQELGLEAAARGSENWNQVATCVLSARSGPEIDACDRQYPMPGTSGPGGPGGPAPAGDTSRERAACVNMLEVFMRETTADMGELPPITAEEQTQLVDECVIALWGEERPGRSPAQYDALLSCITAARSGQELEQC